MFPLSDSFMAILGVSSLFAASSLSTLCAQKKRIFAVIPPAILAIILAWRIPENGGGQYDWLGDFMFIGGALVIVVASAVWAILTCMVANKFTQKTNLDVKMRKGKLILMLVAILPSVALSGYSLKKQYVPDARCSNDSVIFVLGTHEYTVGPEFQPRIEREAANSNRRQNFFYSNKKSDKEDMANLCKETNNGHTSIQVDVLWLTPAANFKNLDSICGGNTGPTKAYCTAYSSKLYQTVHKILFTKHPQVLPSWFQHKDNPWVLTGGNLVNGFVCLGEDDGLEPIQCKVWHQIDSEVTMLAEVQNVVGKNRSEVLKMLDDAMEFTLTAFSNDMNGANMESPLE